MPAQKPPVFPRLAWNQAAIWMGADFFALWRLYLRNRISNSAMPYCTKRLPMAAFGCANTGLWGLQQLLFGRHVENTQLVGDPIFIIGHWRTGTTLLHELMSLDPQLRFPTTFECLLPTHFLLSERVLEKLDRLHTARKTPPR